MGPRWGLDQQSDLRLDVFRDHSLKMISDSVSRILILFQIDNDEINRESNMSAHVLLNLLNKLTVKTPVI